MKRLTLLRKTWLVFLFAFLVQMVAFEGTSAVQAEAVQEGFEKKSGHCFYYQDGKKVTNTWKSLEADGGRYRFYFGKNGAAYQAKKLYKDAYNVKLYKIERKQYGFDNYAHLAGPGIYLDSMYRFVVLGKGGVYDAKKSGKLRRQLRIYSDVRKVSKKMYNHVVSLLGKPVSVRRSSSCDPWNSKDKFTDVTLYYDHYEVLLIRNNRTKEYALSGYFPR